MRCAEGVGLVVLLSSNWNFNRWPRPCVINLAGIWAYTHTRPHAHVQRSRARQQHRTACGFDRWQATVVRFQQCHWHWFSELLGFCSHRKQYWSVDSYIRVYTERMFDQCSIFKVLVQFNGQMLRINPFLGAIYVDLLDFAMADFVGSKVSFVLFAMFLVGILCILWVCVWVFQSSGIIFMVKGLLFMPT